MCQDGGGGSQQRLGHSSRKLVFQWRGHGKADSCHMKPETRSQQHSRQQATVQLKSGRSGTSARLDTCLIRIRELRGGGLTCPTLTCSKLRAAHDQMDDDTTSKDHHVLTDAADHLSTAFLTSWCSTICVSFTFFSQRRHPASLTNVICMYSRWNIYWTDTLHHPSHSQASDHRALTVVSQLNSSVAQCRKHSPFPTS